MRNTTNTETRTFYPANSLNEIVINSASRLPDKNCFLFRRGQTDYNITYSEFNKYCRALEAAFTSLGMTGTHVALIGDKCYEWLAVYLSVVGCGGVIVPLDRELLPEQARGLAVFADCETIVCTKSCADMFEGHLDELPGVKRIIEITLDEPFDINSEPDVSVPDGERFTLDSLAAWGLTLQKRGEAPDTLPHDPESMSIIIFTSGTTGTSKGVMLSEKNVLCCLQSAVRIIDIRESDTVLSVLPVHHTYEMTAGILAPLMMGSTIALNTSMKNVTRDMKLYRPTIMAMVPLFVSTIYKKIRENVRKKGLDKTLDRLMKTSNHIRRIGIDPRKLLFGEISGVFGGRLERIVCGGAPLNPELVDQFDAIGIKLAQGYGITECSPVIAVMSFGDKNKTSCGKLLDGMQLFIDRDNSSDQSGEIVVKGGNVMLGYYKNPEKTAEALDRYGWFRTGDCGYIDENNYVYITGRKKNVIVLENGKNVYPEELEEYLLNIEFTAECAVLGKKTADGQIQLTALIYPDYDRLKEDGCTEETQIMSLFDEKVNRLNKTLPSYKQIRAVELRKTPFPKTSTKKIQRHLI